MMKKKERRLKEDIGLIGRGVREFQNILPGQWKLVFLRGSLNASIPYIAVVCSSFIINELVTMKRIDKLLFLCSITVLLIFLLTLIKNVVEAKIAVGFSQLFQAHETLVISDYSRNGMVKHSILIGCMLCALIAVCAYVSCKTMSKRFDVSIEVFTQGAEYKRYGEFYTMNYLMDENAAMEVRIYEQEQLILKESQEKCYGFFSKGKQKEMRAVRVYDGIRLACISICGILVYIVIGKQAILGAIGAGSVVVMYAAVTKLICSLSDVAEIITDLRNNNIHLLHLFEYMDLPEDSEEKETVAKQPEKMEETCGIIVFENVSFCYPESEEWVLKNINLTVQAGEKLVLVGRHRK